jgi:hypothetical protein
MSCTLLGGAETGYAGAAEAGLADSLLLRKRFCADSMLWSLRLLIRTFRA